MKPAPIAKGETVRIASGHYAGHEALIVGKVCWNGDGRAWFSRIDGFVGMVMVYESEMEG